MGNTSYFLYKRYRVVGSDLVATGEESVDADGTMPLVVRMDDDPSCGFDPPGTRHRTTTGSPYCVGYKKYVDVQYWASYDDGQSWIVTATTNDLVEEYSEDCGYVPPEPMYRWVNSGTTCVGYDKYQRQIKQVSTDDGATWSNVEPPVYSATTLIQHNSTDCGYVPPMYRWVRTDDTMCVESGSPIPPSPAGYSSQYLTFRALEDCTFQFTGTSSNTLSYSLDSGATWIQGNQTPTVQSGSTVMWKGITRPTHNGIGTFQLRTGRFEVEGNVMSLLFGDNFIGRTDLTGYDYAFRELFFQTWSLVSAENLVLPATTLSQYCYADMFWDCPILTTLPALPTTSLAYRCYTGMFGRCASLTTVPSNMLPATTLAEDCYMGMFENCTSLITTPELPATTLAVGCYDTMFDGCTSLTKAPLLPATTLVNYCYRFMFAGCSALNEITCLATDISATECTYLWVSEVPSSGTFIKNPSMTSWTTGVDGIPTGWTVTNYTS